jgi:hypothetical protein
MLIGEAEQFVNQLPWRWVRKDSGAEPHQYVIRTWVEVDENQFWEFIRLVERDGYLARYVRPYAPDRPMVNSYLVIGAHVHWAIPPNQLCRTRVEDRQHEPLPEQLRLEEEQ